MLGIFDSGIGGLSVLKNLKEKLPEIEVVYFGDTKNAPYGTKTQNELKELTFSGVNILLKNGATKILSACNSISTFIISDQIKDISKKIKTIGMIEPTVNQFKNKKDIVIFATPATIESNAYQNTFKKAGITIKTLPFPELAGAIEYGKTNNEITQIIEKTISKTLQNTPLRTVLLCCTHYPFHKETFEKILNKIDKKISVYDPAEAVIKETINKFGLKKTKVSTKGKIIFLISKDSVVFRKKVEKLFNNFEYSITVI